MHGWPNLDRERWIMFVAFSMMSRPDIYTHGIPVETCFEIEWSNKHRSSQVRRPVACKRVLWLLMLAISRHPACLVSGSHMIRIHLLSRFLSSPVNGRRRGSNNRRRAATTELEEVLRNVIVTAIVQYITAHTRGPDKKPTRHKATPLNN